MTEPVCKLWSEDSLREAAMEFMRVDFGLPDKNDREARDRWYERLGLLVTFAVWLWDTHDESRNERR
jgi:hypothetical protein